MLPAARPTFTYDIVPAVTAAALRAEASRIRKLVNTMVTTGRKQSKELRERYEADDRREEERRRNQDRRVGTVVLSIIERLGEENVSFLIDQLGQDRWTVIDRLVKRSPSGGRRRHEPPIAKNGGAATPDIDEAARRA
jgi:hypothetical protein